MAILIAFGTVEGQTGKIARYIADQLKERGVETRVFDTSDHEHEASFEDVDGVILAASVHERRHPKDFEVFLTANQEDLAAHKTLLLSVSLSAAFPEGLEEAQDYADEMKMRTHLTPDAEMLVAGAVRMKRYDYYATQILKHVVLRGREFDPTVPEYEFTDWDAVSDGVDKFLAA